SERLAVLPSKRLELDRGRTHATSSPARPHVEQFGTRETEDQKRALSHPLREVVDQLEQRLLRPVNVLEDHDQRLDVRQLVRELARGPRDLWLSALALDRLHHAGGKSQQLGDRLVAATLDQLLLRRFH